eukprot:gnl/Chilomastix_caulleri/3674.p1 GENE.gnl/Chilomastix_caulleri/3674~~gnl/Chilomastix_caulleri/3674.p1  ORF type:complete len:106 (+),score=19.71 gnl/Chilomastix_caulleri/3674:217-534(+)
MESIRLLIERRGEVINKTGTRVSLRDNRDIEKEFKYQNAKGPEGDEILCSEDLAYHIHKCTKEFDRCLKILAPFQMYRMKTKLYRESLMDEPSKKVHQGYVGERI